MDILWGMFQVAWDYDTLLDTIYIEHISSFPINVQAEIDIRTQLTCVATNKYMYAKESMPKYEKYEWMEVNDFNFRGTPIRYESDCVSSDPDNNTKETKLTVTTDLEYIASTPDDISVDGWVILCNEPDGGGGYKVAIEMGIFDAYTKLNMHLSWSNLHARYFLHNRVLLEGYVNNTLTQFYTSQKTRQQECSVIFCNTFASNVNIKTELGELYFESEKASVKRAELSPTGEVKLTLMYGTKNGGVIPPPPARPWVQITRTLCTHFEAILSEPAPVGGLSIELRYVVFSLNPRVQQCFNSAPWDVWTIAEGLTIASYELETLCPVPFGGCIYLYGVAVTPYPWLISLEDDPNCKC
jgi:hypothetical protein